jgi:hypothetical protein
MQTFTLDLALTRLGEYIASHAEAHTIVVIGGTAINLLGFVDRVTRDVDVLAFGGPNEGPALQWHQGLPLGLNDRIQWRRFDALTVGLVDRYDLIFFKLYAAADHVGQRNVHYTDLLALHPTPRELAAAATWVRDQDPSEPFALLLQQVLSDVEHDRG